MIRTQIERAEKNHSELRKDGYINWISSFFLRSLAVKERRKQFRSSYCLAKGKHQSSEKDIFLNYITGKYFFLVEAYIEGTLGNLKGNDVKSFLEKMKKGSCGVHVF